MKAILFDLDNTLIDFMKFKHVCIQAAIKALRNSGLKIPNAKQQINSIYKKHTMEDNKVFQRFLKLNNALTPKNLAIAVVAYRNARPKVLTSYPSTIPTLRRLKQRNLKLAVVSDAPEKKLWQRLVQANLHNFFQVVISTENYRQKPSKIPFKKALKLLNTKPEDCLFVGDHPVRDIQGAKKVGMKTCLANYGLLFKTKVKPDYTIDKVSDLLKIISQ